MELMQPGKIPDNEYFNNFYKEYVQKIRSIYDNYSAALDGCDVLDNLIEEMLSDFTTSIDKINATVDKINYVTENQQTSRAILTESYRYLSCKNRNDIYFSSLDIFDNMGITIKHTNVKQYDYNIESISSNYPRLKMDTSIDIILQPDSKILTEGIYYGNLYGQVKTFENATDIGYNQDLVKTDDESVLDIEYVTYSVLDDAVSVSLVIKPLTTLNKIDILFLSLLSLDNCFITISSIQYKYVDDHKLNTLDYIKDLIVYPSANSKYSDIYIPLHLSNVEIIVINLKQTLYLIELVKRIYCSNRLLNILETLIVDKTYTYNIYSDKQWTPERLNISVGEIIGTDSISFTYENINRYYIGIRNIKLLNAGEIKGGELLFDQINIDSNVVAIEIIVEDNSDLFKYYISFNNNNIWYPIIPSNKYTNEGYYRYYINKPTTSVEYINGITAIYDTMSTATSYMIKVVAIADAEDYNMLLQTVTIREKIDY